MTCSDFRENLHDYLDDTLDRAARTATQGHLDECAECRLAVQRAQTFGRVIRRALDHTAAPVALSQRAQEEIMNAARASRTEPRVARPAWHWLIVHPFRTLAAAAALAVIALLLAQLRPTTTPPDRTPHIRYSIDVPIESERFRGVIHAEIAD